MSSTNDAFTIRAKIMGVLLRDARLARGKTLKDCGEALGISGAAYSSFEYGAKCISLPELETLALFLSVPLPHFWSDELISESDVSHHNPEQRHALRHRIIGAQIRQARQERDLTQKELAERLGLSPSQLKSYEYGERPIPIPELEALAAALGLAVDDLIDKQGDVGEWVATKQSVERFTELPADLQDFVSKPINEPYLRLAKQLSDLPVQRLRNVAEGLLDITL